MTFKLGVSDFIAFHELDPREQKKCIFYTLKGKRCSWDCKEADNERAMSLYDQITRTVDTELPSLEVLEDYARYNCCGPKPKGTRHQNRIEDVGLLTSLAERWLDEIQQRRSDSRVIARSSTLPTEDEHTITSPGAIIAPFVSPLTTTSPSQLPTIIEAQRSISTAAEFVAGLPFNVQSPNEHSQNIEHESHLQETEPRYDLRRRNDLGDKDKCIASSNPRPRAQLSTFRPHVEEPEENVMSKILSPLVKDHFARDFKTGSLYIFTRTSSPGYVKIGWTSREVGSRLKIWSRCGYEPNLVFSVHDVPYAQRAETLTHYELATEWRAERSCKGCGKSHREWFEVSQERAAQVVADWAEFMKSATIYDANGKVENNWRGTIEKMSKMDEPITANSLLGKYKASILAKTTLKVPIAEDDALEAEVSQRGTPASSERDPDTFELSSLNQALPIRNDRFQAGLNLELPKSSTLEPQISKVLPPSLPTQLRIPEQHLEPRSTAQAERKFLEQEDQSKLSQSSREFQVGAGFNSSFKPPPATKPAEHFLTPPSTPSPQRTTHSSGKSSSNGRDRSYLFEQQGQNTSSPSMEINQPKTKFDFSLNNSVEKHPASRPDYKDVFSFQASIDNRLASRAEARLDFCLKTPPEKPSELRKNQTSNPKFDFLFRPPSQQQSLTDGMSNLDPKLPAENQRDLGSSNRFKFSFDPPPAKEPTLTDVSKFEFSFKPLIAHPLFTLEERGDLSSKTPHEEQTLLPTNGKVDLSSTLVSGKQFTRTRPFVPITPPRSVDLRPSAKPSHFELPSVPRIHPLADRLITPPRLPNRENVSEEEQKRQNVSIWPMPEMIPLPPITDLEHSLLLREP